MSGAPGGGGIEALALHHVRPVDAGGGHLDQDLALARHGYRAGFRHQHFRAAGVRNGDRGHGGGQIGHGPLLNQPKSGVS